MTIGVEVSQLYDGGNCDNKHIVKDDNGIKYCEIFDPFILVGQEVVNNFALQKIYIPLANNTTAVGSSLYATSKRDPKYVDEEDVKSLGEILLNISDVHLPREERIILVTMKFGTCITVSAVNNNTQEKINTTFNYYGN